jgi:hypothetical protein
LNVIDIFAVVATWTEVLVGFFDTRNGRVVSALDVLNPTCGAAEPKVLTPVPPANAEAFCAGLTETATEMAISRKREQMHDSFLIEKFYTKCRISLEAFGGQIRPGLPTWLGYRAP